MSHGPNCLYYWLTKGRMDPTIRPLTRTEWKVDQRSSQYPPSVVARGALCIEFPTELKIFTETGRQRTSVMLGIMQQYFNFRAPGRIRDARKEDTELPAKRRGRDGQVGNIFEHPRCDKER